MLSLSLSLLSLFLLLAHADSDSHRHQKQSSMDFLKPLIGAGKGKSAKGLSQLMKYLSNLGYLNSNNDDPDPIHDDRFDDNLEQATRKYQKCFKLKSNGILDANTVAQMSRPRCGVPDTFAIPQRNHPHYFLSPHFLLRYSKMATCKTKPNTLISTRHTKRHEQGHSRRDELMGRRVALKFTYIQNYNKSDIKIGFQYGDHGDGSPFDGSGGILAQAFRLHFDGDERWVDGVRGGAFDLRTVGLHELGHVLGLGHTPDSAATMYPCMGSGLRKGLGQDDINGIKALYPS